MSDDIVCFECGSDASPWTGLVGSLGEDYAAIMKWAERKVLHVDRIGEQVEVSGIDKVGVVLLPSGRKVIIRSKIRNVILLEWLAYLGELPNLKVWQSDPAITTGGNFHDCIGRLFLRELDQVTRRFVRKDFIPIRSSTTTLRGRLLSTRLCREVHRLPYLPQLARTRSFDTEPNIVLALALDRLRLMMSDPSPAFTRELVRQRDAWAHIRREVKDVVAAVHQAQWACPGGYRNALRLARLILLGASVDPSKGAGGLAFTLSLAAIWEKGVQRMLEQLQTTTGWVLQPSTRPWADATNELDKNRWMTADAHLKRDGIHWVLDTKYKRQFGNESRNDRFQVCAYALGFAAHRATLVYPTGVDCSVSVRLLLNTNVGGLNVIIDSLEMPMAMGPDVCREAIRSRCGQ